MRFAVSFGLAAVLCLAGFSGAHATAAARKVTSPEGISAWLAEDHQTLSYAVHFTFRGSGRVLDRETRIDTATLLARSLTDGTQKIDGEQVRHELAKLGVRLQFSVTWADFSGTLRGPSSTREHAFAYLGRILANRNMDMEVSRGPAADQSQPFDPTALFETLLVASSKGPSAKALTGPVTAAHLKKAMELGFARDRLAIAVVGDVTAADLGPLLDRAFGGLPASSPNPINPPSPFVGAATPRGVIVVKRPTPQSVIIWGQVDTALRPEDRAAAMILAQLIGGVGDSRLYRELREQGGLAYFVHLVADPNSAIPWVGAVSTRNASASNTIELIRAEWRKIADEGVLNREVEAAKASLRNEDLVSLTSYDKYARRLAYAQLEESPYSEEMRLAIQRATAGDVARVARRLDPGKLLFIVMGRPEGVVSSAQMRPASAAAHATSSATPSRIRE